MPSFARNKGKRGEHEVILHLQQIVSRACFGVGMREVIQIKRNLNQTREGGCDIIGLDWCAIEVKRHENASGLKGWWRQALKQAEQKGKGVVPILLWRQNNSQWNVVIKVPIRVGDKTSRTHVLATVEMDWQTFLVWFEQRVKWELKIGMKEKGWMLEKGGRVGPPP
jgi:hypothetical protein